jgi:hypothetical protein
MGKRRKRLKPDVLVCRFELESRGINLVEEVISNIGLVKNPASRAALLIKIMPYVYPTLSSMKVSVQEDENPVKQVSSSELMERVKLILERKEENGTTKQRRDIETDYREMEQSSNDDGGTPSSERDDFSEGSGD